MLPALVELKRYILEQSIEGWNSVEHARTVTRTLEAILKVAEVRMGQKEFSEEQQSSSSFEGVPRPSTSSVFESDEEEEDGDSECEPEVLMEDCGRESVNVPLISFTTSPSLEDKRVSVAGYEADTEQKTSDTVSTGGEESSVNKSSSVYETFQPGLSDGVCEIVMEILFELSRKCVADPVLWSTNLNAVLNHLTVVSRSLGGTEAILRGFAVVLETSDVRLRELQKSILALVQHILTPGSLSAYMSLFTAERPPVDLLLPKFYEITVARMEIREPICELEFPTRNGKIIRLFLKNYKPLET